MHDVSDGGLAVALVECCVATDHPSAMIGAEVSIDDEPADIVAALFSESPSRVVASVPFSHVDHVKNRAARAGVPLVVVGATTAKDIVIRRTGADVVRASLDELRDARENCLAPIIGT